MTLAESHKTGRFPWTVILFAVPAIAILIGLGTWQVQRLAWKEDLLARIDARIHSEPITLSELEAEISAGTMATDDLEYRPVTATGTFDHTGETHFFATFDGLSGYYLYTPLERANGKAIFINRGFVPFDKKDPATRPESLVTGEQKVTGLARGRLDAKPSWLVPENDPAKNIFYWKDLDAMAALAGRDPAGMVPYFIDENNEATPTELPVGGVTIIDLPNSHLQYAVTWYGLALALFAVVVVFVRRRMAA